MCRNIILKISSCFIIVYSVESLAQPAFQGISAETLCWQGFQRVLDN